MSLPWLDRLAALWTILLLVACGDQGTGPKDVKWDRETCERCRMVLSDRHHAAQIRYSDEAGRSRVRGFDDIGCAVIWVQDKPWRDVRDTEVWVTDWRNGDWIDARRAFYLIGQTTPMGYGLGAQPEAQTGALSFNQAKAHIFDIEQRFNVHGGHGEETLQAR